MKLSWTYDKEIDQNEIESEYLWKLPQWESKIIKRINLSKYMNDSSWIIDSSIFIKYSKSLPNNQIFGLNIDKDNHLQYLFISDENFRLKKLEKPISIWNACRYHTACFYDGSIFIFENNFGSNQPSTIRRARRYAINQNKWTNLPVFPFDTPTSCTGINQKIVITTDMPGVYIYDIILESYSRHSPIEECWSLLSEQMLIKFKGRMYMISRLSVNHIYYCDDPLSEWTYVCAFKDKLFCRTLATRTFYKESIYYFSRGTLHEFSLTKFESKEVKAIIMH